MADETTIQDYIADLRADIVRSGGDPATAAGMIVGAASTCWDNLPGAGVFESSRASALVDLLLEYMRVPGLDVDDDKARQYELFFRHAAKDSTGTESDTGLAFRWAVGQLDALRARVAELESTS